MVYYGQPAVGEGNPSPIRIFLRRRGYLELVMANAYSGLFHISADDGSNPRSKQPTIFGDFFAKSTRTSLIESNLDNNETFELITLLDLGNLSYFIYTPSESHWLGVSDIPNLDITFHGFPSRIQLIIPGGGGEEWKFWVIPSKEDGVLFASQLSPFTPN